MDPTYPMFAAAHPLFYDRATDDRSTPFAVPEHLDWSDWHRATDDHWAHWVNRHVLLPEQGWKIHVSVTPRTAAHTLKLVSTFCHGRHISFKHVRTEARLAAVLAKDADRSAAGKFVTLYPHSEKVLHETLTELDAVLGKMPGPYILTDLRWNAGPLHVRYGAFRRQFVFHEGIQVPAVRNLDSGALVPDVRDVAFRVPAWVQMPAFLEAQRDALDMSPPDGFPLLSRALHYSNAGGVYDGVLDDREVIVKEARPHSGWTPDGRDAVARLRHEEEVLRLIRHLPVPAVIDAISAHGHRFLLLEKLGGVPLPVILATRHPLTVADVDAAEVAAYRAWALHVATELREVVAGLHRAGIVHGDLHPGNVIVDGDTVQLVDFEMAVTSEATSSAVIGAPGFVPADTRDPIGRDLFAVACIELHLFCPMIPMLHLHADAADRLVRSAQLSFELDDAWSDRLVRVLRDRRRPRRTAREVPTDLTELIDGTVSALIADADVTRSDRLWPGDPSQFSNPAYSLAYGALGVAHTLTMAGAELPAGVRRWIEDAQTRCDRDGLLDGIAGAALNHPQLDVVSVADRLVDVLKATDFEHADASLYSGLPGIALALLAEGDAGTLDLVATVTERLAGRWMGPPPTIVGTNRGGLLRGASGTALLAVTMFERTGQDWYLDTAEAALDFDLASLVAGRDGSLHVNEGWRSQPYLAYGSAGIGMVLLRLLHHRPHVERFARALDGIVRAASARFTVQAGLFHGRSGLLHFLTAVELETGRTEQTDSAIRHHIEGIRAHALPYPDGLRFTGDRLLRASCDLATGSAGVLTALLAVRARDEVDAPPGASLSCFLPTATTVRGR